MYIVYSGVYMYSYMYIKKNKKKKKQKKKKKKKQTSLQSVLRCKKMGDHLNLQFPFFTSSGTRQLQNKRGGGRERLYLSRVVRNPSRVISSGFTEYICRS